MRSFLIGVLSMACASATADYPAQEHWSAEQREVWEAVLRWNDAFERNDADAYFLLIDDEVVVLTPGNPYRVEYAAPDRREFEVAIERGYGEIRFFQELGPRVDVFGETAATCSSIPSAGLAPRRFPSTGSRWTPVGWNGRSSTCSPPPRPRPMNARERRDSGSITSGTGSATRTGPLPIALCGACDWRVRSA
jgi:ketosteroid isomerase-like protein